MSDSVTLRSVDPDEIARFREVFALVFGFEAGDEEILDSFRDWIETDRTIAAFDGDAMVGTGGTLTFRLVVPGGSTVPAAGLTVVSVAPTHRRRGLLRRIMDRHFDDADDKGECVSILYASESSIYGRFGYGQATESMTVRLDRSHAALRSDLPEPAGSFRVVTDDSARTAIEEVYAVAVAATPGAVLRREGDWNRFFFDPPQWRSGATALRILLYERDGAARGYARYRQKLAWNDQGPDSTLSVEEVQAVDGEAYASLWRFLLSVDLAARFEAQPRPVDEPLRDLLADPRRVERASVVDSLWLRLLDVPAALSARTYRIPGSIVLRVDDPSQPQRAGTFLLDGGPDGATCEPSTVDPDVTLDVADLGAAYLGAPRLATLGWLGRVHGDPEAISLLDAMFTTDRAPHCSLFF